MGTEVFDVLQRLFIVFLIMVAFFFLFVCWIGCKNRSGTINRYSGTPVTVTTTHVSATPVVQPPYPITPRHPTPQSIPPPGPGFVPVGGYQSTPYPPAPGAAPGGAPYPSGITPYPPATTPYPPAQTAPPPSYSEAVGQPPVQPPPTTEQYSKQSPYNPNY